MCQDLEFLGLRCVRLVMLSKLFSKATSRVSGSHSSWLQRQCAGSSLESCAKPWHAWTKRPFWVHWFWGFDPDCLWLSANKEILALWRCFWSSMLFSNTSEVYGILIMTSRADSLIDMFVSWLCDFHGVLACTVWNLDDCNILLQSFALLCDLWRWPQRLAQFDFASNPMRCGKNLFKNAHTSQAGCFSIAAVLLWSSA